MITVESNKPIEQSNKIYKPAHNVVQGLVYLSAIILINIGLLCLIL